MDGKIERVNQVLEDMLCMYVTDKPTKWEDYLHFIGFSYSNGQRESLGMSPYDTSDNLGGSLSDPSEDLC